MLKRPWLADSAHFVLLQMGLTGVKRSESLNGSPVFIKALADIAAEHLQKGTTVSTQMMLRCPGCTNETCGQAKEYFHNQTVEPAQIQA